MGCMSRSGLGIVYSWMISRYLERVADVALWFGCNGVMVFGVLHAYIHDWHWETGYI
jgi:hypothetical protein